jgi:carboxypeptidase family protein
MYRPPNIQLLSNALLVVILATGALSPTPTSARTNDSATSAPRANFDSRDTQPAAKPVSYDPEAFADSTAAPHAPSRVEIRGFVHDANGGPVRGATIRLTSETDTVQVSSDASGRFHARLTAERGVRVLVQAYGYRDLVRSFRASRSVIQAALALPPPYPLGWVTVTMADSPCEDLGQHSG